MQNYSPSPLIRLFLAVALLAAPAALSASTWDNIGGGDFGDAGNWDPGVPGTTDSATFGLDATYTVTFDDDYENTAATVSDGTVTLNLNGNTYTTTASSNAFAVQGGATEDPSLLITGDGTLITGDEVTAVTARIGTLANGSGSVTVNDAVWDNSGGMMVGISSGTGSLTIENGGQVINRFGQFTVAPGSQNSLLITGEDSNLTLVGNRFFSDAGSSIRIEAGGSLNGSAGNLNES